MACSQVYKLVKCEGPLRLQSGLLAYIEGNLGYLSLNATIKSLFSLMTITALFLLSSGNASEICARRIGSNEFRFCSTSQLCCESKLNSSLQDLAYLLMREHPIPIEVYC